MIPLQQSLDAQDFLQLVDGANIRIVHKGEFMILLPQFQGVVSKPFVLTDIGSSIDDSLPPCLTYCHGGTDG